MFNFNNPASTSSIAPKFSFTNPAPAVQAAQPQYQVAQPPTAPTNTSESFARTTISLLKPHLYGDARDGIIARLNQLQAFSGEGKGYYEPGGTPVQYTLDNQFCRFKSVGYSHKVGFSNEDGLVALTLGKNATEVESNRQLLKDALFRLMGNKPNLTVNIDGIRPLPDDRCLVLIFVTESQAQPSFSQRRVGASELLAFFNGPSVKPQLSQAGVADAMLMSDLSTHDLEQYLKIPPVGLDPMLWAQACKDNPDPATLIPVQILGFEQLRNRQKLQLQQAQWQTDKLKELEDDVKKLELKIATSHTRILQLKLMENQLAHRLLKLLCHREKLEREGCTLDALEENLQIRLESVSSQLNAPFSSKNRLSELMSLIRGQPDLIASTHVPGSKAQSIELDLHDDLFLHLKRCQDGLERMTKLVHTDLKDLQILKENVQRTAS